MNTLKFYKILVVILVVLNIATLATIWLGRLREPRFPHRVIQGEPLLREMKLSPQQRTEFREQRQFHVQQLQEIQSHERELHERFFDLVFSEKPDSNRAKVMIDSILQLRKEMEMMTFRHFQTLKGLLNPQQMELFRKNFNRHFNEVMPPPEPVKDVPPPPPPPVKNK